MDTKAVNLEIAWPESSESLLKQYSGRKHPLDYKNRYQLMVMVILAAQDSDKRINKITADFFKAYPSMKELADADIEDIRHLITSVRSFRKKSSWLSQIAKVLGDDANIPVTLAELTKLPGIGRKSANVIIRESGIEAEGIIVDLHVVRVALRLGVTESSNPDKIEKQLMNVYPKSDWNEIGMSMSFLGREICRPTNPQCPVCVMNTVCLYYNSRKDSVTRLDEENKKNLMFEEKTPNT
ncbi:MAG TPA: endonuclease III [Bacteroidales bacterium]|jgi:endonuclease-3|nr:endonuclease III [Bacteroidales bacterium]